MAADLLFAFLENTRWHFARVKWTQMCAIVSWNHFWQSENKRTLMTFTDLTSVTNTDGTKQIVPFHGKVSTWLSLRERNATSGGLCWLFDYSNLFDNYVHSRVMHKINSSDMYFIGWQYSQSMLLEMSKLRTCWLKWWWIKKRFLYSKMR